jgi:hypothetical protein
MKEIIDYSVCQMKQWTARAARAARAVIERIAKFSEVKCEIEYIGVSPGFPWNMVSLKLLVEGSEGNIKMFKKGINHE